MEGSEVSESFRVCEKTSQRLSSFRETVSTFDDVVRNISRPVPVSFRFARNWTCTTSSGGCMLGDYFNKSLSCTTILPVPCNMASTLFVYEGNHNQHAFSCNNAMKRNRISSDGLLIDLPSNFLCPETVDESDLRSQKTTDACHGQGFTPSEAASEDSCSMKRKFMSSNWDSFGDAINSGAAYLSSGKPLTRDERKQLRKRLKIELDQVHKLMLRLEARELDLRGFLHMPKLEYSGCEPLPVVGEITHDEGESFPQPIHAVTNLHPGAAFKEKRTLKASQLYSDAEFVLGKDRMLFSEKLKPRLGCIKRSLQLKGDLPDIKRQKMDTTNMRKLAELMRQCGTILKKLMSHRYAWIFNEPVDVVKLGLHDYFKIIEKPMDLGTIKSKLECGKYKSPLEFADDIRLTFANAMKYNPKGHDVHIMADVLRMLFEDRWRPLAEKLRRMNFNSDSIKSELYTSVQMVAQETLPVVSTRRSHAAATVKCQSQLKPDDFSKLEMTFDEKRALSKMLENLPLEKSEQVIMIIKRKNPKLRQIGDAFEVDIDAVDSETLWELHNLVTNWKNSEKPIQDAQNMSERFESVQVQSINRAFKSSRTALRGGDSREEDIDVGVDVPSTSFPPTNIGKDAAASKCSSSSSSSSDSGSSSSDSDSGSSSGSESDADDAQSPGAGSNILPEKDL